MPISQSEQLIKLVKSLTKAEKRNFRLYTNRLQSNESTLFLKLFEHIEKQDQFNEDSVRKDLGDLSKVQFSNLKRHLYTQVITSLRLIHKQRRSNIQVREYLDFAYILYGKGLYLQALKLLSMAKRLAEKHHLNLLHLTIIEFEKTIHSRHITRSKSNLEKSLIGEATKMNTTISNATQLSNLRIRLHGKYIRYGHVKNSEEENEIKSFFEEEIKNIDESKLGVIEQVYLYQSYVWYYYILLDFTSCLAWAEKWLNVLKGNSEMLWRDVDLLMRAYHYILTCLFNLKNYDLAAKYQEEFEQFRKSNYKKLNPNSQIISFLYTHTGRLNNVILSGDFNKGLEEIPKTLKRINRYQNKLDDHRILVFYYKIAWIYLGNNQAEQALKYLNKIVNQDFKYLRTDIQAYSRLLFLICHYELENDETILYLINRYKNHFNTDKIAHRVAIEIFKWLSHICKAPLLERKELFIEFEKAMIKMSETKYDKRAFLYLDIVSWIKTKTLRKPLAEIVSKNL